MPKCVTDQAIKLIAQGTTYQIGDYHPFDRDSCVGDPCSIRMHASARMVSWCAANGIPLKGKIILMRHLPCFECAKLLAASGLFRIDILDKPKSPAEEEALELLAVIVTLNFGVTGEDTSPNTFPTKSRSSKKSGYQPKKAVGRGSRSASYQR